MSRDVNGNYSLPAGNPVASGTVITIAWGNSTLSDVGTEITNSLDRSGRGGMLAALKGIDGTVAAPAFSFTSEPTSGWYRISAGVVGLSVTNRLGISQVAAGNVTIAAPSSGTALSISPGSDVASIVVNGAAGQRGGIDLVGNAGGNALSIFQSSALAASIFQRANSSLDLSTNSTQRVLITASGNVTINAPSSGTTLSLTPVAGGVSLVAGKLTVQDSNGLGGSGTNLYSSSTDPFNVGSTGAANARIYTNSTARIDINSAGNVTINAPSSGTPLSVTNLSGNGILLQGATTNTNYYRVTSTAGDLLLGTDNSSGGGILSGSSSYAGIVSTMNSTPLILGANGVARFWVGTLGQLGIGGATYGTAGQLFTSGGSGAAPSWSPNITIGTSGAAAITGADITARGIDIVRYKNAITSRTTTITTTADPDLTVSLVAGAYSFEVCAWVDSVGGTPGIRTALGFSGGVTGTVVAVTETLIVSTFAESVTSSPFSDINWGTTSGSSYGNFVIYRGWIQVSSTGNLTFNWAQSSSSASATNVRPGSYMKVTKLD